MYLLTTLWNRSIHITRKILYLYPHNGQRLPSHVRKSLQMKHVARTNNNYLILTGELITKGPIIYNNRKQIKET
jgi:hypothetical protein